MFRIFWAVNNPTHVIKNGDGKALEGHLARANRTDCYLSLNVYPRFDEQPSHYDLGFDFDSPDIRLSAMDALRVCERLSSYDAPYRVYFSGSKGVHIVVPHGVLGFPARADGGQVTKLYQRWLKKEMSLETLDTDIHGTKRMWRCVNTINSKSGRYKVQIPTNMLGGNPDLLRSWAEEARPVLPLIEVSSPGLIKEITPFIAEANEKNAERRVQIEKRKEITLNSVPVCVAGILNDPAKVIRQAETWGKHKPSRNDLTFIAATFFKTHAGAAQDETLSILGDSWQGRVARISSSSPAAIARSTRTAVEAVYQGSYDFSCGMAVSRGCECFAGCPLHRTFDDARRDAEKRAAPAGASTDGD